MSMRTKPLFISVGQDAMATGCCGRSLSSVASDVCAVSGVDQGYVVVNAENRFLLLFTFLKKNRDKKVQ